MTPTGHTQDSSRSPFAVDKPDQLYSSPAKSQACLSSSDHPSHFFTYPIQDQGGFCHREIHQLNNQEAAKLASLGSNRHQITQEGESDRGSKPSLWKKENESLDENQSDYDDGSIEWMPAKRRLILKMMKPDQFLAGRDQKYSQAASSSSLESIKHGSNINEYSSGNMSSNPIRVCSDCNTTKTPLWRSGPKGPKSLCNACGIRQRKARRAMAAAAAAAANGTTLEAETSPTKTEVQLKAKRPTSDGYIKKYKKRSKISTTTTPHGKKKKICFEEFLIGLSNNLAFHRVFPQDEKEAAILLMALSCGLVHG